MIDRAACVVEFDSRPDGDALDRARCAPCHLPQRSSRERAAALHGGGGGRPRLHLRIGGDRPPWCPERRE